MLPQQLAQLRDIGACWHRRIGRWGGIHRPITKQGGSFDPPRILAHPAADAGS
jgi:hypothetical protein